MKRIIITRSQLNEVMDSQKTQVTFTGTNANELGANAQEKYNDALSTGLKPNAIQLNGKSVNNNATDKDETVIGFDATQSNIRDAVKNSVNTAVNNGADINKLSVQGNTEDVLNGTNENVKRYDKRIIEQARLYEMRRNGKIMTKKELRESIIGDKGHVIEKLKSMNMFQALECFRQVYGDEALQNLSYDWNMLQGIVNVFYDSDEQKQQEFLELLNQ